MSNKFKVVLIGVAFVLLLTTLILILWLKWIGPRWAINRSVKEFETSIISTQTIVPVPTATFLLPTPISTTTPVATETLVPTPTATLVVKDDFLLRIPSIQLEWLVHHIGADEENNEPWGIPKWALDQYGVVDYPHLSFPGQEGIVALAGHRDISGSPFWSIEDIQIGDKIVLETIDGRDFSYTVYRVEIDDPDSPVFWEIKSSQELRLISCRIADISKRVFVFAELNKE